MSSVYLYYQYITLFVGVLFYCTFFSSLYNVNDSYEQYQNKDISNSLAFLGVIICIELVWTYCDMNSICPGLSGTAVIYPILVWVLIMGGIKMLMLSSPGVKSAFSDVIGYFFVYGRTNKLLTDLLVQPDGENKEKLDNDRLITEIMGEKGLLINTMVPGNFEKIWASFKNISNPKIYNDIYNKQKLLNYVVIRDRIGECCWYLWCGILVISILSLYSTTITCDLSQAQAQINAAKYNDAVNAGASTEAYVTD
jgi:hypothetical protein